jgi:YaiO family outer membrane protein
MKKDIYLDLNKSFLTALFVFIFVSSSYSQGIAKQSSDSSDLRKAIYLISIGQTEKAITECRQILQKKPEAIDANILLARLFSWEYRFDTARIILVNVLQSQPVNKEALIALVNVEVWSKHYDRALRYADRGLSVYPDNEKLLIKKTEILVRENNLVEASKLINKVIKIYPGSKEALNMQEQIKNKKVRSAPKNAIGLFYQHDNLNNGYTPWNSVSAYFYSIRKWGIFSAGINYANRYGINGTQYELDLFPRISHSLRAYVGGAYSKNYIFPNYNVGVAVYQRFLKIAELEVGARYLSYSRFPSLLQIYTGGLRVSKGHWQGKILTYLIPGSSMINQSYQFSAWHSFKNPDNKIMILYNTGLSPRNLFDTANYKGYVFPKKSNRIEFRYQRPFLSNKTIIKASAGYEKNEYFTGLKRHRISAGIGIERLF